MRLLPVLAALALLPALASAQECAPAGCPAGGSRLVRPFAPGGPFAPPREMAGGRGWYAQSTSSYSYSAGPARRQPVRALVGRVFGRCR